MNITFVFPDWIDPEATIEQNKKGLGIGHFNFAIATLSAILKSRGHRTKLMHVCYEPDENQFRELLAEYKDTDLFAFSFTEVEKHWVRNMNGWIKETLGTFTIGGGIFPTLQPERTLMEIGLDASCIGEGDIALPDLCDKMQKDQDIHTIRNIFFRHRDRIIKNETGQYVENLDELPRYDYDIFDPARLKIFNTNLPRLYYLCTRNCPFGCAFCANHAKRKAIGAGKHYVRKFSTDRVIADLKFYLSRFPQVKLIHFADEVIHFDKPWFMELMEKYKTEINLPWRSYAMISILDNNIIKTMADSNCTRVNCGIEAGSQRIRRIYNRPAIQDDKILETIAELKNQGIDVHTSTLLNAPTETLPEMVDTIKLVAKADTDVAVTGIVVPYEGTKLYEYAREKGILRKTAYENTEVSIEPANCNVNKIIFLYNAYRLMVETYKAIYRQSDTVQKILIPIADTIFMSKYLPHKFLIKIRKLFFEGVLINYAYRRIETKLGRREKNARDALRETEAVGKLLRTDPTHNSLTERKLLR